MDTNNCSIWTGSIIIRRAAKPNMDKIRRREYSLKFMIESISNLSSKKRYHCELKLNNRTYARTSSRNAEKGEAVWNEIYELCNLAPVASVTINLYKELVEGKGDKRRNIRQRIAFVTVPIEELYERNEVRKKLTMQKHNSSVPNDHQFYTPHLSNITTPSSSSSTIGCVGGGNADNNNNMPSQNVSSNNSSFCIPNSDSNKSNGSGKQKRSSRSDSSDYDPSLQSTPNSTATLASYKTASLPRANKRPSTLHKQNSMNCAGGGGFLKYWRSRKESGDTTSNNSSTQNKSNWPKLSISAKYQCLEILPLQYYHELRQFVLHNYISLVSYFDSKLSGRRLEEVASCLVSIHELAGTSTKFLTDSLLLHTANQVQQQQVVLRANTIGSKSIESYMKLVGMEYLQGVLGEFSTKLLHYPSSLEVDPARLEGDKTLLRLTQVQLSSMVQGLVNRITTSVDEMPIELRHVFAYLRKRLKQLSDDNPEAGGNSCIEQIICSCLFLRFLCPAVLNPYLYQLIREYPQDPRVIRNFTLISKSLQTLANHTSTFCTNQNSTLNSNTNTMLAIKEAFMQPIHESLLSETTSVLQFLHDISSHGQLEEQIDANCERSSRWANYIDQGYELASTHRFFTEIFIDEPDKKLPEELKPLITILQQITSLLSCQNSTDPILQNHSYTVPTNIPKQPQPASSNTSTTTHEIAQLLSRNCQLLAENAASSTITKPQSSTTTGSIQNLTRKQSLPADGRNGSVTMHRTRGSSSAAISIGSNNSNNSNSNLGNNMTQNYLNMTLPTRYSVNIDEIDTLWKRLVQQADSCAITKQPQVPRHTTQNLVANNDHLSFDIDLDPDFHMDYKFGFEDSPQNPMINNHSNDNNNNNNSNSGHVNNDDLYKMGDYSNVGQITEEEPVDDYYSSPPIETNETNNHLNMYLDNQECEEPYSEVPLFDESNELTNNDQPEELEPIRNEEDESPEISVPSPPVTPISLDNTNNICDQSNPVSNLIHTNPSNQTMGVCVGTQQPNNYLNINQSQINNGYSSFNPYYNFPSHSSNSLNRPSPTTPSKSIRMGTKVMQNNAAPGTGVIMNNNNSNGNTPPIPNIRKSTTPVSTNQTSTTLCEDIDSMLRLVSDTEQKYIQARKEIEDKEKENQLLREMLLKMTNNHGNNSNNNDSSTRVPYSTNDNNNNNAEMSKRYMANGNHGNQGIGYYGYSGYVPINSNSINNESNDPN